MTTRARVTALALALALLARAASAAAADVPLRYLVDERALRTADAATTVDVGLFSDAACGSPTFQTTLRLGDVDLLARVPGTALRGAAKPPRMAELRHVLHEAPPSAPLYARVAGTGIVPIGGDCQAQTIATPPQSAPMLVDAAGTMLGPYGVVTDFGGGPSLLRGSGDLVYSLTVYTTALGGTAWELFFEAPDCSSPPLIYSEYYSYELVFGSVLHGSTLYYPAGATSQRTVRSESYAAPAPGDCNGYGTFVPPDHCCVPLVPGPTFDGVFTPTATLDLAQFQPPFHVELR